MRLECNIYSENTNERSEKDDEQIKKLNFYAFKSFLFRKKNITLTLRGISMLPSLQNGSIVNISVDWDCYKFGDIVLIEWGTIFVVHRLVDVRTMRTKGDNLTHFDPEGLKIVGFISSISTHSERLGTFLSKIEGQFYCNSKHNSKSCKMFFKVLSSLKYLLLKRKKKNELKQ